MVVVESSEDRSAVTGFSRNPHEDSDKRRVSVLHLMNAVADSSITTIVSDQIKYFGCSDYDWHVGGLGGVEMEEPFQQLGARVVDFSANASGKRQLCQAVGRYVRDNDIQLIHTHTPRTTVTAAAALGYRRRAKIVTTKHSHAESSDRPKWGWVFKLVDRCAIYMPDLVVAVSEDVRRRILSLPGLSEDRVTVVRNAVDVDTYDVPQERAGCRAEFRIPADSPVLGFAGRITKLKRIDLLLDAFATVLQRYPEARLLIAGDGEEMDQLQNYARTSGVANRVVWAGHRRDMPRLLAAIDLYIQSSVNEGLSLSLLQAMSARKPVVATDVGGTREVVNEETGLLIPPGASQPIAQAVLQLLDQPELTARLVAQARELVTREFSVPKQMDSYRQVYESLVSPVGSR